MRIIDFGPESGVPVDRFGSQEVHAVALVRPEVAGVIVMHVDAGGQIGVHEATVDQLFIVVSGSGEVSGDDEVWRPIRAGQAAFWLAGEKHGTRAANGLTSVVVEMTSMPLAP